MNPGNPGNYRLYKYDSEGECVVDTFSAADDESAMSRADSSMTEYTESAELVRIIQAWDRRLVRVGAETAALGSADADARPATALTDEGGSAVNPSDPEAPA